MIAPSHALFRSLLLASASAIAISTAAAQVSSYEVTNLGSPVGQSGFSGVLALGLSSDGNQVVGFSVWEPFRWQEGVGMVALAKLLGFQNAVANDANVSGSAVGYCGLTGTTYNAVLWDAAGNATSLHMSNWQYSQAVAINDAGTVLLRTGIAGSSPSVPRAYLTTVAGGGLIDPAPNAQATGALDLNERDQALLYVDSVLSLYTPGSGLQALPAFDDARLGDRGQVAGCDGQQLQRWTNGMLEQLGTPPQGGGGFRRVGAIDAFGQIAASQWIQTSSSPPSYSRVAWIYTDGLGLRRLDSLVETPPVVTGYEVAGIADGGRIAMSGSFGPDNRAMLLEPKFVTIRGSGCAGTGGAAPRMQVAGVPTGGERLALLAADAQPNSAVVFALSLQPANVPLLANCTLLLNPVQALFLTASTNVIGQAHATIDLPPTAPQVSLYGQFLAFDAGVANGLTLSNGIQVDLQ